MSDGEFLVIAALIRKLGGDVTITDKEIQEAREMEVLRCESQDFFWDTRFKVRPKPVTIEGETVPDAVATLPAPRQAYIVECEDLQPGDQIWFESLFEAEHTCGPFPSCCVPKPVGDDYDGPRWVPE